MQSQISGLINFEVNINKIPCVENNAAVEELFKEFSLLEYPNRVAFFDKYFKLIPREFLTDDLEVSWYNNETKLNELVIRFKSDLRGAGLMKRSFEGSVLVFDIRPLSTIQRITLNQYILSKLLEARQGIQERLLNGISQAEEPVKFLNAMLAQLTTIVEWTQYRLAEDATFLKSKFLRVFYNGFLAFRDGNEKMLNIRRNIVELYLYSQGLLLAEHLEEVQKSLQNLMKESAPFLSLSLPHKIVLLHELGVIEFLKEKFKPAGQTLNQSKLANIICLMTSENPTQAEAVIKYLSHMGAGTSADLLSPKNVKLVRQTLELQKNLV